MLDWMKEKTRLFTRRKEEDKRQATQVINSKKPITAQRIETLKDSLQDIYAQHTAEWVNTKDGHTEFVAIKKIHALLAFAKSEGIVIREEPFIKAAMEAMKNYVICTCKSCGMPIYTTENPTRIFETDTGGRRSCRETYVCTTCASVNKIKRQITG